MPRKKYGNSFHSFANREAVAPLLPSTLFIRHAPQFLRTNPETTRLFHTNRLIRDHNNQFLHSLFYAEPDRQPGSKFGFKIKKYI